MNAVDCFVNELEFRICTNCEIHSLESFTNCWQKCGHYLSTVFNIRYFLYNKRIY